MAAIIKTANTHQTSLLISEQIPDFIRGDHPKFVTFIEKYYEFLAQANSGIATSDGLSHYYGADYATKAITDINDIDTTDLDKFIGSFQKQYGHGLPRQVADSADTRLLYKNLVDFYRAVGTEDSFRMLFRLLFNDEIEIYYPFQDVLIASGGEYTQESRIRVNYVENLNDIENTRIVGATSGAYGTVERVQVLPGGSDSFITGRIGNTSIPYTSGVSNTEIYDPMKYLEHGSSTAHVYMTDQFGNFDFFEDIYVDDVNSTVSNTIVLPMTKRMLAFEDFQYGSTNSVVSMYDGLAQQRATSTSPPWGSANIDYSNTGIWHTTGDGTGEIKLVSNVYGSYGGVVLEIGNNSTLASATGDQRHIVFAKNVGIGGEDILYRMSIRARDLGGNSAVSVAEGNRFSAGVSCVRHDLRKLSADNYKDQWEDPLWLVSHKQAIDDEFFVYTAYFKGRETRRSVGGSPYSAKNYGNGGRRDLTSGTRYYNSAQKAVDREVLLPFNTTFIKPTFKVNEPGDGATYSQGITQIDFISLEELTPMQTQLGMHSGSYRDERSLLSTTGAHMQDGHYWQIYAYDIRSKQQIKDYATVVREAVHPAGMKMFGTTIVESSANGAIESANTNLLDTFSPNSLDSLAGWWSADSVVPENFQVKRDVPGGTSNAVFGSTKNRLPLGWFSDFDDTGVIVPDDFDHIGQTYRNVSVNNASVSSMLFSDDGNSRDRLGLAADTKNKRGLDKNILKLTSTSWTAGSTVALHYNPDDQKYWQAGGRTDYYDPIVLEPFKRWVLSYWEMTSNNMTETIQEHHYSAASPGLRTANSSTVLKVNSTHSHISSEYGDSGFYRQVGNVRGLGLQENYVWQRNAVVMDMRKSPATRAFFQITVPHRISAGGDISANVVQWYDGFMLEEYSNTVHGRAPGLDEGQSGTSSGYDAVFPYKTPYVKPGYSGANVISWNDRSPNKHHVYANTHGGIFYTPQYVANAINGLPAIRFSANTVINNPTSRQSAYVWSDHTGSVSKVYEWSSIGGPGTDKPPTVGLQATKSLASNTLSVPVANTWTVMAVVQSNLTINSSFYDSTLNPMIINSGYGGNKDSLSDGALNQPGTLSLGYDVDGTMGAVLINTTNSTGGIEQTNTATVSTFGAASPNTARPLTNTSFATGKNVFRIVGVSINAASGSTTELLNFHVDGRRFSNSEINNISNDLSRTGLSNQLQQNYVTSIGAWAPSNNTIWDTGTHGVNAEYPYGTASWDGDIAEIVVFNEKLSNTKIALVEGYLAHKYRLQEHLIHKDGTTNETEVYRWEYANTQNGWEFLNQHSPVPITYVWEGGDSNNYIKVTGAGQQIMQITLPTHIHGATYDKVGFRYKMTDAGMEPTSNIYAFKWKNDASATLHSLPALGNDGHNGLNVWTEKYFDLSGQAEWVGKKITYLQYDMNAGVETVNQIDWVYVSGNNHPHPYRYNAPTAVGANNWNINY